MRVREDLVEQGVLPQNPEQQITAVQTWYAGRVRIDAADMPEATLDWPLAEVRLCVGGGPGPSSTAGSESLQQLLEGDITEGLSATDAAWIPCGVLPARPHHPGRQAGAAGTQGRHGRFSAQLFARYQGFEMALGRAGRDVHAERVDRKVKAMTSERCGHSFPVPI
jgi:hypothetical protein